MRSSGRSSRAATAPAPLAARTIPGAGEPENQAHLRCAQRGSGGEALDMRWQDTWFASPRQVTDRPIDLWPWRLSHVLPSRAMQGVNEQIVGLDEGRRVRCLDINAALMNADRTLSREIRPDLLYHSRTGCRTLMASI